MDKKYAKRFSTISAWAELVGYVGNVTLNGLRIAAALERELMLTQELVRRKKVLQSCCSLHCLPATRLLVMLPPKLPLCSSGRFKEEGKGGPCHADGTHCALPFSLHLELYGLICMAVFLSFAPVMQEDDTMPDDVHLIKEVQALRARRLLRTLAVVQDLSDALMAVNDVTGGHPVTFLAATCF